MSNKGPCRPFESMRGRHEFFRGVSRIQGRCLHRQHHPHFRATAHEPAKREHPHPEPGEGIRHAVPRPHQPGRHPHRERRGVLRLREGDRAAHLRGARGRAQGGHLPPRHPHRGHVHHRRVPPALLPARVLHKRAGCRHRRADSRHRDTRARDHGQAAARRPHRRARARRAELHRGDVLARRAGGRGAERPSVEREPSHHPRAGLRHAQGDGAGPGAQRLQPPGSEHTA